MVADLVRNIGGDRIELNQICGSGVDPHLYKATRDDVLALMNADIVFYSGLHLEGKMTDTLVKLAMTKPVIAVTDAVPKNLIRQASQTGDNPDPHMWMDVNAWSKCCQAVVDELSRFDEAFSETYKNNAENYIAQLDTLHEYGKKSLSSVPTTSRVLITSHDAFGYFGSAYGIEVLGVQGISTESEAGLQQINQLVSLIVDRKVSAVFVESSVSRKNIEALVEGARSRQHEVVIGGELFSDAMGIAGTYEGTYIGMLDHNITTVTRALGGQAPPSGLNGKLSH